MIFYKYKLNEDQMNLVQNINDIRNQNNIPLLIQNITLPVFIINKKTELFFYNEKNFYKLSQNFYLFKYQKEEFKNFFNNNEAMNIITNDILNEINIIEQDNIVFISIYKKTINNNDDMNDISNNEINIPKIQINASANNDISKNDNKSNDKTEVTSMSQYSDNDDTARNIIRAMKVNKNLLSKK